jgi:hypothetical protein
MRHAAALAAGEDPQQAGGRAARRRGILIIAHIDRPGALAERDSGKRHYIIGVEIALGLRPGAAADSSRQQHERTQKTHQSP